MTASPPASQPLLVLEKLTKQFGNLFALSEIDLEISAGEFVTIFGPNGAGKTTLLRVLASLTSPTKGKVSFLPDGSDPSRHRVGYVSHQSLLYNEMTGRENLVFYGRLYSLFQIDHKATESLKMMGLSFSNGSLRAIGKTRPRKAIQEKEAVTASPPASQPLLVLEKLTKQFGNLFALSEIDLEISAGEFVTIFGPNGAGKTTLLRVLASLTSPTKGKVSFLPDGSDPSRHRVGYVSHQSLLYNEMTGRENLVFYGRLYSLFQIDHKATESLKMMGLSESGDLLVRGYSRGMKQRLTLARALLHDPYLLLLDEPYVGLDRQGCRLLTDVLRRLKDQARTVLLITHNLSEGLELCDRVLIQHRGSIVFDASSQDVDRERIESIYFQVIEGKTVGKPS